LDLSRRPEIKKTFVVNTRLWADVGEAARSTGSSSPRPRQRNSNSEANSADNTLVDCKWGIVLAGMVHHFMVWLCLGESRGPMQDVSCSCALAPRERVVCVREPPTAEGDTNADVMCSNARSTRRMARWGTVVAHEGSLGWLCLLTRCARTQPRAVCQRSCSCHRSMSCSNDPTREC